mmetsp:Transcript_30954/g.76996  ORF Transcript_30954/g.76996 Transcript_30954/m.76996 type:complete len:217 (+) Transcript_30954:251-901(+)
MALHVVVEAHVPRPFEHVAVDAAHQAARLRVRLLVAALRQQRVEGVDDVPEEERLEDHGPQEGEGDGPHDLELRQGVVLEGLQRELRPVRICQRHRARKIQKRFDVPLQPRHDVARERLVQGVAGANGVVDDAHEGEHGEDDERGAEQAGARLHHRPEHGAALEQQYVVQHGGEERQGNVKRVHAQRELGGSIQDEHHQVRVALLNKRPHLTKSAQ